jgi:hypothetical protein
MSCATVGMQEEVRPCRVSLAAAEVAEVRSDSFTLRLEIEIHNPNESPVEVMRFDADVLAEGQRLVSVSIPGPMRVEPSARDVLEAVFRLPASEASSDVLLVTHSARVEFGLEGRLYFAAAGDDYSFRVSSQ